jgi:hypothetical protein
MLRMTLSETPRDEHSLKFRRMECRTEDIHPQGTNSPQGANFTSGGQSSSLGTRLKTGLFHKSYLHETSNFDGATKNWSSSNLRRSTPNLCRPTKNSCCPAEFCLKFVLRVNSPLPASWWGWAAALPCQCPSRGVQCATASGCPATRGRRPRGCGQTSCRRRRKHLLGTNVMTLEIFLR